MTGRSTLRWRSGAGRPRFRASTRRNPFLRRTYLGQWALNPRTLGCGRDGLPGGVLVDAEGLWQEWCQAAEAWLQGWTGFTDRRFLGRGRSRRSRLRPAKGRRGPVGAGEVGAQARHWLSASRWLRALAEEPAGEDGARGGAERLRARLGGTLPQLGGVWAGGMPSPAAVPKGTEVRWRGLQQRKPLQT